MRQHRIRGLSLALVGSFALALTGAGAADAVVDVSVPSSEAGRLLEAIRKHRATTWHWQRIKGNERTRSVSLAGITNLERLAALHDLWKHRATRQLERAKNPPHEAAWRCIHRHEGSWDDPNGPYYGGLQMNEQFQRGYGRYLFRLKGTAEKWTPAEQMWTAERAVRAGTGFHPWPNTARYCGLF